MKATLPSSPSPPVKKIPARRLPSDQVSPSSPPLKRLLVKDQHKLFFIKVEDILYCEADGNYITMHTRQRTYLLYESLTQLEQRLDSSDFTRIHRSYLINLNYVEELENYFNGEYLVKLTGGHTLKWTRFYRANAKDFLTKYQ
jgi:two-component system LytT family response regulator